MTQHKTILGGASMRIK